MFMHTDRNIRPMLPCALDPIGDHSTCGDPAATNGREFICSRHFKYASADSRERKRQTGARLQWIRERWADDAYYNDVVASGRYLKLCEVLRWAEDNDELAWQHLKAEIARHERDQAPAVTARLLA